MANKEQLDILKRGVEEWNAWREAHPDVQPDLSGVFLSGAILRGAILRKAILSRTHLGGADLSGANLSGADLTEALTNSTLFADIDLRSVQGLETIQHLGPSTIGVDTLYKSGGNIPEAFLRGCGVPNSLIEYLPSLIGAMQPI